MSRPDAGPATEPRLPSQLLYGTVATGPDGVERSAAGIRAVLTGGDRVALVARTPALVLAALEATHGRHPLLLLRDEPALIEAALASFQPHALLSEDDAGPLGWRLRRLAAAPGPVGAPAGPPDPILLATSGTTGPPKLVHHERAALAGRVQRHADPRARWLLTYGPATFAGLQVLLTAAHWGATLVGVPGAGIDALARAALEHGVTHLSATPTRWRSLLGALGADAARLPLRQVTLGGEAVDQPLLDRLGELYPLARRSHVYASTEAGAVFAVRDGWAGFPAAWLDEGVDGEPEVRLRIGPDGVLEVRTPRRMVGYHGAPEAGGDWVRTGDLVEVDGDRVRFAGRADALLSVAGAVVQPEAVEALLRTLPGVRDAHVHGRPSPLVGAVVAARLAVVPGTDTGALRLAAAQLVGARLSRAAVPRLFEFSDDLDASASGKKARAPEPAAQPRVVLVTGGSRGLGLALVADLLEAGYQVATCSRSPSEALEKLAATWGEQRMRWWPCTLGDEASERAFAQALRCWAPNLWGLVNNAGMATDALLVAAPPEQLETVVGTNLLGTMRLTRLALRSMLPNRAGRVVTISSIVGLRGYTGLSAYGATKAALDGFSRGLAREVGRRAITVNSIAPGFLDTEMAATLGERQRAQIVRRTPLGRLGTTADVAPMVRWLLSDEAAFVTGQTIVIDGGITT